MPAIGWLRFLQPRPAKVRVSALPLLVLNYCHVVASPAPVLRLTYSHSLPFSWTLLQFQDVRTFFSLSKSNSFSNSASEGDSSPRSNYCKIPHSKRASIITTRNMSTKRKAPATSSQDSTNDSTATKKSRAITSFFTPSANSSSKSSDVPAIKFDKDGWYKSLNSEQKELLKLEYETLHVSWLAELKELLTSNGFLELKRFLKEEKASGKVVYPEDKDIYSWSRFTPLNTVKIVILGQDPYHGPNQAHGLSFSVRPPTPAPPSLVNMYQALSNDYPSFQLPPNRGGLLTPWAEQGVLMLNACLTVVRATPNAHAKKGWEMLTEKAIDLVAEKRTKGVVFMAWGSFAQSRCKKVDKKRHLVLQSVHPSPLSAHRGFFECGHFKKANEFLESRYGIDGIIDWNLNRPPPADPPSNGSKPSTAEKAGVVKKAVEKQEEKKGTGAEKVKSVVDEAVAAVVAAAEAVKESGTPTKGKKKEDGESDYDSEGLD